MLTVSSIWSKTPTKRGDTKLNLMVRLQFLSSEECEVILSLPLLLVQLWPNIEVPLKISSMGEIDNEKL